MKIPNDLPWNVIVSVITLRRNKDYVLNACNNFPKSIELLSKIKNSKTWVEGIYSENIYLSNEIDEFLKEVDNDNA